MSDRNSINTQLMQLPILPDDVETAIKVALTTTNILINLPITVLTRKPYADELQNITVETNDGVWSPYYSQLPDFFGLTQIGRDVLHYGDNALRDETEITIRALLGLIMILPDNEFTALNAFIESLVTLDRAGCQSFWVGHRGIIALAYKQTLPNNDTLLACATNSPLASTHDSNGTLHA